MSNNLSDLGIPKDFLSKQFEDGHDFLQKSRLKATAQYRGALRGNDMNLILPNARDTKKGNELYCDKVKTLVCKIIESRAPRDSVVTQSFSTLFKRFDRNNDGKLTKSELGDALRTMFGVKMPPSKMNFLFDSIDSNGNGTISQFEFLDAFLGHRQPNRFDKAPKSKYKFNARRASIVPGQASNQYGAEDGPSDDFKTKHDAFELARKQAKGQHNYTANAALMSTERIAQPASLSEIRELIRAKVMGRAKSNTDVSRTMRKVFACMDSNGDGLITKDEFQTAVLTLFGVKLSRAQNRLFFDSIDADGSGALTREELVAGLLGRRDRSASASGQTDRQRLQKRENGLNGKVKQEVAARAKAEKDVELLRRKARSTMQKPHSSTLKKSASQTFRTKKAQQMYSIDKSRPFESWKPFDAWS